MTRLTFDERNYEYGVEKVVLYPKNGTGVPWNGISLIKEAEDNVVTTPYYIEGLKYLEKSSSSAFTASIVAYIYPDILESANLFGLSYKTRIGDTEDYKLHIVYNALIDTSDEVHSSINQSFDILEFDWNLTTTPVYIPNHNPSAHLIIDSRVVYPWVLSYVEDILYGIESFDSELPDLDALLNIFEDGSILKITDNGDGTWTAESREEYPDIIQMLDSTTFQIDWPSAIFIDSHTYTISSL